MSPDTLVEVRNLLFGVRGGILVRTSISPAMKSMADDIERAIALLSPEQAATPPAAKADDMVEAGVKAASALFTELPERTGHLPAGAKVVTPYEFNNIVGQQLNRLLSALDIPRREAEAAAREREACARIAEKAYGGKAHTYASENADVYRAQDAACVKIAAAIRSQPAARAPEENLEPAVYKRHDKVIVTGEDFEPYEATVLGPYWKLNGKVRYNVEDRGRNFVQRPKQLSPAAKAQGGQP